MIQTSCRFLCDGNCHEFTDTLSSNPTPKRSYPSSPQGLGRPVGGGVSCTRSALAMGLTLYLA